MRQLVESGGARREPPFLPALRAQFGAKLAKPLRLREEATDGGPRWIATACVDELHDGTALAAAIGTEVWLHTQRAGQAPAEVLVKVQAESPAASTTIQVPRPVAIR